MLFFFSIRLPSKSWPVPTGENSTFIFLVQLNFYFFPFILSPCPKAVFGILRPLSLWILKMAPGGWVIKLRPLLNAVSLSHRRWIHVFLPLSWDKRFFGNILHCENMGHEGEKVSSRGISAHSCTSLWLCRILPGIYFSFHSHRHSRRHVLSVSFFRDEESKAKWWSGVLFSHAAKQQPGQGLGTGLLTHAICKPLLSPSWLPSNFHGKNPSLEG